MIIFRRQRQISMFIPYSLALFTLLFFPSPISAAVKSKSDLEFKVGDDYTNVMTLSQQQLSLKGTGLAYSLQTISSNATLGPQNLVLVDSSSASIELTLPEANNCKGRVYTIKKISALNSVTINAEGFSTTIDGIHQYKMGSGELQQMSLLSDGDEWFVTSKDGNEITASIFSKVSSDVMITDDEPNLIVDTSNGDVYLTLPDAGAVSDQTTFQFIKSHDANKVYIASRDYDDTIDSKISLSLNEKGSFLVSRAGPDSWTTPSSQHGQTAENRPLVLKIEVPEEDLAFTLPFNEDEVGLNVTVHWGVAGETLTITDDDDPKPTHHYTSPGTYTIQIHENQKGSFTGLKFGDNDDAASVIELSQWGSLQWKSLKEAFYGCSKLKITATDSFHARTGKASNFVSAWEGCTSLTSFPFIHTDSATNMNRAWSQCSVLKGPFPLLNTSRVTSFYRTWQRCSELNGNFPNMDFSAGESFTQAWSGVTSAKFIDVPDFSSFRKGMNMYENVSLETSFWNRVLIEIASHETSPSDVNQNSITGGSSWHGDSKQVVDAIHSLEAHQWAIIDMGLEVSLNQDTIIDVASGITKIYADSSAGNLYLLFPDASESESITVVKTSDDHSVLIASKDIDDRFHDEYRLIMKGKEGQEIIISNDANNAWTSNKDDMTFESDAPFQIEVEITPDDPTFDLPLSNYGNPTYDINIKWGDGNQIDVTSFDSTDLRHTYTIDETKTFVISITENSKSSFGSIFFNNDSSGDKDKVTSIINWGQVTPLNINAAFSGCKNMTLKAEDSLHARIQRARAFYKTFKGCSKLTGAFPNMNTSHMTSIAEGFQSTSITAIDWTHMKSLIKGSNAFLGTQLTQRSWGQFLISLSKTNNPSDTIETLTGPGGMPPSDQDAVDAKAHLISQGWTIVD